MFSALPCSEYGRYGRGGMREPLKLLTFERAELESRLHSGGCKQVKQSSARGRGERAERAHCKL
jgi:hypothetical protein